MPWPPAGFAFDVQLKGMQQGQFCYVNLAYYQTATSEANPSLVELANMIEFNLVPLFTQVQVTSYEWLSLRIQGRGSGNTGKVYNRNLSDVGLVVDESLPVYNTWSFSKFPDNSARIPLTEPEFRPGRFNLSGVPESWVSDGFAETSRQTTLDTVAGNTVLLTDASGRVWGQLMRRDPDSTGPAPTTAFVPVVGASFNRLGTQLTRKY